MTKDEMVSLVNSAVTSEDVLAVMPGVIEQIKADYDTRDALEGKVAEMDSKIRGLQDTNLKLYLAQTGSATEDPEEEELEGMEAVDAFWDDLLKEDK